MGSIAFTIKETGQPDASKTYVIPDLDIDRIVAAYQQDANVANNRLATRNQVLAYIVNHWIVGVKDKVRESEHDAAMAAIAKKPDISTT